METTKKAFLDSLISDFNFAQHNKQKRENLIANFSRLKNSVPFSLELNEWVIDWYEQNKFKFIFTDTDDFDANNLQETLSRNVKRFHETGKIHIWKGDSERTIFGSAQINHYFRAWHDHTHIINELGYDFAGESIVCSLQFSELPTDWLFEKELVAIEIIGQGQYYSVHNEFLKDQRKFSMDYIKSPMEAIFRKQ